MCTHTNVPQGALERLRKLVRVMKAHFWKNDECIELMVACAIAGEPLLLLGEPGTGKTAMAKMFFEETGLPKGQADGYFEKSLHPYTELSDVFGPLNFAKLTGRQAGVAEFERDCRGYLPSVRGAFLDEIFAASPEFLLTLLSILEERVYHNGLQIVQSPLSIAFAASNDLPSDDRLRALRDRLPVRIVVDSPQSIEDRQQVLTKSHRRWVRSHRKAPRTAEPACRYEDIAACRDSLMDEKTPEDFAKGIVPHYLRCIDTIARASHELAVFSPRAQQKIYQVMRALALLRRGDPEPDQPELLVLRYTFKSTDRAVMNALHAQLEPFGPWPPLKD
jgi:MoxR-like ATPase